MHDYHRYSLNYQYNSLQVWQKLPNAIEAIRFRKYQIVKYNPTLQQTHTHQWASIFVLPSDLIFSKINCFSEDSAQQNDHEENFLRPQELLRKSTTRLNPDLLAARKTVKATNAAAQNRIVNL